MSEDGRLLGDPPAPPDEVWSAALAHAFDPWAEPDAAILPGDTYDGGVYDDGLAAVFVTTDDPDTDDVHGDTPDTPYDGDTPAFDDDHGYSGYDNPGFADTDDYL
ncbi:MAG: hypothetical protein FWF02_05660 [Micrococcales bacterium]|nr:hypothetical protein [Micrococcales bacterium]MCL2667180.1 hypothetical protein [Micrococcales bacterium]